MAQPSLRPAFGLARLLATAGRNAGAAYQASSVAEESLYHAVSRNEQEDKKDVQQSQVVKCGVPSFAAAGALARSLSNAGPSMSSLLAARKLRTSMPPAARLSPLLPHQGRAYHAWTPAQRYFVEGDHVIATELGRGLQFTGLDSGSFAAFVPYTLVAGVIASVFMILPFLVAPTRVDLDKASAYECGFDAFGEARQTFNVSFYLVSIMYLLFDIEIAYLFPYVMTHANGTMFWTMNLFLVILVAGFVYEWGVGALEWRE